MLARETVFSLISKVYFLEIFSHSASMHIDTNICNRSMLLLLLSRFSRVRLCGTP